MMLSRLLLLSFLALSGCSNDRDQPQADLATDARYDLGTADAEGDLPSDQADDLPSDFAPDLASDLAPDLGVCKLLGVYSSKIPACNDCAETRCCPELNSCFAAPECNDGYVNCMLACALAPVPDGGVAACLDLCATEHAVGKALYEVAMRCAEGKCVTECE